MKITIKGAEQQLHFGIFFIKELDEKYFMDQGSIQFGQGINTAFMKLKNQDPVILFDVLSAALNTRTTLTGFDFDEFFCSKTEKEIEELCDQLVKKLETEPMTAPNVKKLKKAIKDLQKEQAPKKHTNK